MASTSSSELFHTGPLVRPTLLGRLLALVQLCILVGALYLYGLPGAIVTQLRTATVQGKPLTLLNLKAWRNAILEHGFPTILRESDKSHADHKRAAIRPFAHGRVLEVGAGTGMTVKYYDAEKITELYLVEPFTSLHASLHQTLAATASPALQAKTQIVPYAIEQHDQLARAGVRPASFDTITLVQVLCSIGAPKKDLAFLQSLLKPGGQILAFEHVASDDTLSSVVQHIVNPVWRLLSGGCNVNRRSFDTLSALGGWQSVTVHKPIGETGADLFPHNVGRFVKA